MVVSLQYIVWNSVTCPVDAMPRSHSSVSFSDTMKAIKTMRGTLGAALELNKSNIHWFENQRKKSSTL